MFHFIYKLEQSDASFLQLLKIAARITLDLHGNQSTSLSQAWNLKETHKK